MQTNPKTLIRKTVFSRRKEAAMDDVVRNSHIITEKVCALPEFQNEDLILAYMDCKKEVMTRELIELGWKLGKTVAVPRVEGEIMRFYQISSYEDLEDGYFGIQEPKDGLRLIEPEHGFLIVPGVAFDPARHRVGYGKGFYDRYQAQYPHLDACAIAFDFQVFEEVPFEATDVCPKYLVTESAIYQGKE